MRTTYTPYIARIGSKPGPMLEDYSALIGKGGVHVAERDGAVLGVLVLVAESDALLLDNIAVAPAAHGSGLGRLMLNYAEKVAIDAGLPAVRLYTNEAMTENIALYAGIGYVETHRATEKGLHRVFMRKRVGAQSDA